MKILYSFNKTGAEAEYWQREIMAASDERVQFVCFNHVSYLSPNRYPRAQLLDNLYYERDAGLERMYTDVRGVIEAERPDVLLVDNAMPYHPEFLRTLSLYKVLRTGDGPLVAYDRDFAYHHAYDQVLYHSPAYSRDLGMAEKLAYCRCVNADFWPNGAFDALHDPSISEEDLFSRKRDIDVIFVGAMFVNKMPLLASVKKKLGKRFVLHGLTTWKRNLYFNVKFGMPGWVRPIEVKEYASLYRRAKIGINVHNRGKYTIGSYRLFDLPANGVMQLSDGDEYLNSFYEPGSEVIGYSDADDMLEKIEYYLTHDAERLEVARAGYARVMRDHRMQARLRELPDLIAGGMRRIGWKAAVPR